MLLSYEECKLILNNTKGSHLCNRFELRQFEIKRARDVTGFMGDYYYLTLYYRNYIGTSESKSESIRLFVKSIPEESDELEKEYIFRKEAQLYETLFNELKKYSTAKWCPDCYFTRPDVFVLEDLLAIGYAPIKKSVSSLDDGSMEQLLKALAALHTSSLLYDKENINKIGEAFGDILQEITISPNVAWYTTGLAAIVAIIKTHPNYQLPIHQKFIENQLPIILESVYDMTKPSDKYVNVVCQRDCWETNILFDRRSESKIAILVDFQTARYCPPCIDLLIAFYMNLERTVRKEKEAEYIEFYYQCLMENFKHFDKVISNYITKQQLIATYNEFRLLGAVYRAVGFTIIKVPPKMVTNAYKFVDRRKEVLDLMKTNEKFRLLMLESTEEIMRLALQAEGAE